MKKGSIVIVLVMATLAIIGTIVGVRLYIGNKNSGNQPQNNTVSTRTQASPMTSATPDETVAWKTYTNTEFHYTVKYPEGWTIDNISYPASGKLKESIGFTATAPSRTDVPGANGKEANYFIQGVLQNNKIVPNPNNPPVGQFAFLPPGQAVEAVALDEISIKGTPEYKIGQEILASFKLTN